MLVNSESRNPRDSPMLFHWKEWLWSRRRRLAISFSLSLTEVDPLVSNYYRNINDTFILHRSEMKQYDNVYLNCQFPGLIVD